ncbi:MAG TPA: (2Fe-2S)-binding protein [Steroidobacteraceae bacterium]|nr:(2Fe-2S)-binding protein [Steroidobacteraceae bacterium]
MAQFTLSVDGESRQVESQPETPLLYALRGQLGLKGPKFGCGFAQCGACTVIVNGAAVRSCMLPISSVADQPIRTLDGLAKDGKPHLVQLAFIEEEAAQCGYCTNAWVMNIVALLEQNSSPTREQIREQLAGLKCRCGMHMAILRAAFRAAAQMRRQSAAGSPGRA